MQMDQYRVDIYSMMFDLKSKLFFFLMYTDVECRLLKYSFEQSLANNWILKPWALARHRLHQVASSHAGKHQTQNRLGA